ncbi:MAG: transglycosylase domain-containing protein [Chitinophagaceae bacterium]|nr:transglycosylase domain-containing protein [Chitinophagaceae bacterium]
MKRSVKILWRLFIGGLLAVVLLFTSANFGLFGKMPSVEELQNPEADLATEIYTSDGVLMGKYYAENRSEVKYNEISPNIIHALVATEDERFYDHAGIDAQAVARAVVSLGSDGGGSTLTQQVAKMMLGQGLGNKLQRSMQKIKEWIVAVKLERNFTKEEIITLYLNRAPWGNIYGIRNAARSFFQKEPKDLKLEEAAVLVGMLKAPSNYNPITKPKESKDRRNTVIGQMVVCKEHYLTEAEAAKYKAKELVTNFKKLDENVGIAPYFRTVLADWLKDWCTTHKNPKTGEGYNLFRDGLKIYTTINSRMQQYAEESVVQHQPVIQKKINWFFKSSAARMWKGHENVIEAAMKYTERWKNMKEDGVTEEEIKKSFYKPVKMKVFAWNAKREIDTTMTPFDSIRYHKQLMQTSFVAMDPHSGEVKCWAGGIDFKWFKYDHVTAARQVGSTFKPLVYSLAVMEAGYTPETNIPGGSLTLGGKTITGGGGAMAYCLAQSKNKAAWTLIGQVGVKRTLEFAKDCGIKAKLPPYYSIALGSAEIPMLEMLQSYTMFPNKGLNVAPILVNRIEDKNGNLLQEFTSPPKQVMAEGDAFTMVSMMQGVIKSGTAKNLNAYNIPVQKAGKTGTTNGNADGWFIGYTPELIAGTWVGCDDPFLRIYSGTSGGNEMAAPKWGIFMSKVYADKKLGYGKIKEFEKPATMSNEEILADANMNLLFNKSDGTTTVDEGNGDAEDFFSEDQMPQDNAPAENIGIESEIPQKVTADTGKKTNAPDKTPGDKTATKNEVTPLKPAEDKTKKTVTKPAEKPKSDNDY